MKIDISGIEKDINFETAKIAHNWISFSPDRQADRMIANYIDTLSRAAALIEQEAKDEKQKEAAQDLFDRMRNRCKKLYTTWISAKSRCMSSAITGGSNFPVAKARKANGLEENKMLAVYDFESTMHKYIKKSLAKVYTAQEKQSADIINMRAQLEAGERLQEAMKAANKAYKAFERAPDCPKTLKLIAGLSPEMEKTVRTWQPEYSFEALPYAGFQLKYNLANVRRIETRLRELEAKSKNAEDHGEKTEEFNGMQVVKNYTEDRLQLLFEEKPPEPVRQVLKSNGFKWSPKFEAWQRKLTSNALYSLKHFILSNDNFADYLQSKAS